MNRYILKTMEKVSVCFRRKYPKNGTIESNAYAYNSTLQNHFELLFSATDTLVRGTNCKHTYKILCIKVTSVESI